MSNFEALFIVFAVQHFRHAGKPKDGDFYGPGYFRNPSRNFITGLTTESRRAALRLARRLTCIACDAPVSEDGVGDHVIPTSWGGPNRLDNYLPMCQPCNSAKGARHFLDWRRPTGKTAADLDPDALCVIARITFQWCESAGELGALSPGYLTQAANELLGSMPTHAHVRELSERAQRDAIGYFSKRSA